VPAVGSSTTVTVNDASWAQVGEMVTVGNAGGGGNSGALQITAIAGNTLTLLNPPAVPSIPPADSTQAGLLKQLSGNTTDFVDGTNTCQNLANAVTPTIWSVRLRSFNAIGNPTFEVNQRSPATSIALSTVAVWPLDRWAVSKGASPMGIGTVQQPDTAAFVPGTNFQITQNRLDLTVQTQQASLGAGDYLVITHNVEGPNLRELLAGVHSLSLLVKCTSTPLKFGVTLVNGATTYSLSKLCTLSAAINTWQLIPLPNLPVWTPSAAWNITPGNLGYLLRISLACGTTYTTSANDNWVAGNFIGAVGQDNFAALPVNTVFSVAFVQHEPGPVCSTLIDCPFGVNLDGPMGCQRYFQTTYPYGTKPGTVTNNGCLGLNATASAGIAGPISFRRTMAKVPTITGYSPATGAANNVRDVNSAVDRAISGLFTAPGDSGFSGWSLSTQNASATNYTYHYVLDTGW